MNNTDTPRTLIVGDWVVDDNWLTGVYRSSTSLRTGDLHRRTLHKPGNPVRSFCGAGRLASILHTTCKQAKDGTEDTLPLFHIAGLGVWHYEKTSKGKFTDDTLVLQSMFDWDFRKQQSPVTLQPKALSKKELPKNVDLFNLAHALAPDHQEATFATTRVLRFFERQVSELILQNRTDSEHPPTTMDEAGGAQAWIGKTDRASVEKFLDKKKLSKENVSAVIIKDLIKGVVSTTLIKVLAHRFKDVPWFVSTKRWNPPWLQTLAEVNLKLLLIPPTAANTAIAKQDLDLDAWIAPTKTKKKPTKGAMRRIDELRTTVSGSNPSRQNIAIVVAPREGSVLASQGDNFSVFQEEVTTDVRLIGWATAFFSAMCASILHSENYLEDTILSASKFAANWAADEAQFIRNPDQPKPGPPRPLVLAEALPVSSQQRNVDKWSEELEFWAEATTSTGIIEGKNSERPARLELWRGMTALDGYICFDKDMRKRLSALTHGCREIAQRGIDRHESVLLLARPGSGKTHLVECLARAVGLNQLSFNMTHMNRREDILSCFDTIVTSQAADRKPLLVFVDEINAEVMGSPVYNAFLSPLEEGLYVRGGTKFHIPPCIWVFAGTAAASSNPADKYDDFESRLTMNPLEIGNPIPLDRVYLGAQLVRKRFSDVRRISRGVLSYFSTLTGSVRDLRKEISRFRDVQNGEVSKANIPDQRPDPEERKFVEIE